MKNHASQDGLSGKFLDRDKTLLALPTGEDDLANGIGCAGCLAGMFGILVTASLLGSRVPEGHKKGLIVFFVVAWALCALGLWFWNHWDSRIVLDFEEGVVFRGNPRDDRRRLVSKLFPVSSIQAVVVDSCLRDIGGSRGGEHVVKIRRFYLPSLIYSHQGGIRMRAAGRFRDVEEANALGKELASLLGTTFFPGQEGQTVSVRSEAGSVQAVYYPAPWTQYLRLSATWIFIMVALGPVFVFLLR